MNFIGKKRVREIEAVIDWIYDYSGNDEEILSMQKRVKTSGCGYWGVSNLERSEIEQRYAIEHAEYESGLEKNEFTKMYRWLITQHGVGTLARFGRRIKSEGWKSLSITERNRIKEIYDIRRFYGETVSERRVRRIFMSKLLSENAGLIQQ